MRKLSKNEKNFVIHNTSVSPSKSRSDLTSKHVYFCHYNNGLYMGESKNFQKHGKGMIIHDNGTTLLCNYHQDMLHKSNVAIFKDGSIASLEYNKDTIVEALFKNNDYMLFVKYKKGTPDGPAILLKIKEQQIQYLNYKMGDVVSTCFEKDSVILNRVFLQKNYSVLFPRQHYLNIELSGQYHDELFISRRVGKIIIGFSKDQLLLNGLGIIIVQKNPLVYAAEYQILQRGYYKNSQLSGFGHRHFKNGNSYSGQFKFDQFQGTGILKNAHKNNWVCGNFQKGTLVQLLTYGNSQNDRNCTKTLQCIHQKKTTWVNRDITIPVLVFFTKELEIISRFKSVDMNRVIDSRKSQVLKKIQHNFMYDGYGQEQQDNHTDRNHHSKMQQLYHNVSGSNTERKETQFQSNTKRSLYPNLSTSQKQSRRRNKIFQSSPNRSQNNPDTYEDPEHSFGINIPQQNSKETQSRIQYIQPQPKQVRFSFKTPIKNSKTKTNTSLHKSSLKTTGRVERSVSNSNIHHKASLIDQLYRKNSKIKLY